MGARAFKWGVHLSGMSSKTLADLQLANESAELKRVGRESPDLPLLPLDLLFL